MIDLIIAVALQAGVPTDAEACAQLQALAAREVFPRRLDAVTMMERTTVDCPGRTLTYNKVASVNAAQVPASWREVQQRNFNQVICNGLAFGPMARRGWTFREHYRLADDTVLTIDALCV